MPATCQKTIVSLYCIAAILLSSLSSVSAFVGCPPPLATVQRHRHILANSSNAHHSEFTIEQVSDRYRSLDVSVFRRFSISAAEYQQQWLEKHNGEHLITKHEAVVRLTPTIDDNGRDTAILGGLLVTFIAISSNGDFDDTNGVVAAVDAKMNEDHVYLKNLKVDKRVRRRGLAAALVKKVKRYTKESTSVNEIVLHVKRPDNVNAIALYEKEGFVFDERMEGDGRMVFKFGSD